MVFHVSLLGHEFAVVAESREDAEAKVRAVPVLAGWIAEAVEDGQTVHVSVRQLRPVDPRMPAVVALGSR